MFCWGQNSSRTSLIKVFKTELWLPRDFGLKGNPSETVAWAGTRTESHTHPFVPWLALQWNFPRKGAGGSRSRSRRGRTSRSRLCLRHPAAPTTRGTPWRGPSQVLPAARRVWPRSPGASARHLPPPASPLLSRGCVSPRQVQSPWGPGAPRPVCVLAPHALAVETRPRHLRAADSFRAAAAGGLGMLSCGAAGAAGAERMPSRDRAPAVQGRARRRPLSPTPGPACAGRGPGCLSHGIR